MSVSYRGVRAAQIAIQEAGDVVARLNSEEQALLVDVLREQMTRSHGPIADALNALMTIVVDIRRKEGWTT